MLSLSVCECWAQFQNKTESSRDNKNCISNKSLLGKTKFLEQNSQRTMKISWVTRVIEEICEKDRWKDTEMKLAWFWNFNWRWKADEKTYILEEKMLRKYICENSVAIQLENSYKYLKQ